VILADDRYGDAEAVTFRYPKVKPDNGKRSPKANISVGKCEPCRRERYIPPIYLRSEDSAKNVDYWILKKLRYT